MAKDRSIEAKRIKIAKMRKKRSRFLKPDRGVMKVNQAIDRSRVPEEYQGLFEYRKRGASCVDDFLDAKFPSANQISQDRQQALALANTLKTFDPVTLKVMMLDGRFTKIAMIMNGGRDCIQFIKFDVRSHIIMRSITYNNYNRAMEVFHLQSFRWKDVIELPRSDANTQPDVC